MEKLTPNSMISCLNNKKKIGRPPILDTAKVKEHYAMSKDKKATAEFFEVTVPAIYYHLNKR